MEISTKVSPLPLYLRDKDVANMLAISVTTLAKWRQIGYGPDFVKIGYKIRYATSAVSSWLESKTRTSTAETPARGERG